MKALENKNIITIVSGLPRSGTSMMMRMLEAGGMEALTDSIRLADENNPLGYYEYERVKKLQDGDTAWVTLAMGKVVKVISFLLTKLPMNYEYKVVFLQRNMAEILASQQKMLILRGQEINPDKDALLSSTFTKHLQTIQNWLAQQPNIKTYYISYNDLLSDPSPRVDEVMRFLDISLSKEKMLQAIDQNLYRNRK